MLNIFRPWKCTLHNWSPPSLSPHVSFSHWKAVRWGVKPPIRQGRPLIFWISRNETRPQRKSPVRHTKMCPRQMSDRAAPLVTFTVLNEAPAQKNGGSLQHFPQIKGESNKKKKIPNPILRSWGAPAHGKNEQIVRLLHLLPIDVGEEAFLWSLSIVRSKSKDQRGPRSDAKRLSWQYAVKRGGRAPRKDVTCDGAKRPTSRFTWKLPIEHGRDGQLLSILASQVIYQEVTSKSPV